MGLEDGGSQKGSSCIVPNQGDMCTSCKTELAANGKNY